MSAINKRVGKDIFCPFSERFVPLKQNVNGRFYYHVSVPGLGAAEVRLFHEIDTVEDLIELANVQVRDPGHNDTKAPARIEGPSIRNEGVAANDNAPDSVSNTKPDVPDFGHIEPKAAPSRKPAKPKAPAKPAKAAEPKPQEEGKPGDGYFDELY